MCSNWLAQPFPIQLRWLRRGDLSGPHPGGDDPLGGDADIVEVVRRLPARRLVILDGPGSGKSVLAALFSTGS